MANLCCRSGEDHIQGTLCLPHSLRLPDKRLALSEDVKRKSTLSSWARMHHPCQEVPHHEIRNLYAKRGFVCGEIGCVF